MRALGCLPPAHEPASPGPGGSVRKTCAVCAEQPPKASQSARNPLRHRPRGLFNSPAGQARFPPGSRPKSDLSGVTNASAPRGAPRGVCGLLPSPLIHSPQSCCCPVSVPHALGTATHRHAYALLGLCASRRQAHVLHEVEATCVWFPSGQPASWNGLSRRVALSGRHQGGDPHNS